MAKSKIAIVIYTLYGHIYKLAEAVKKGVESTGAEATIYQVPETLPADVLTKMHAPPKPNIPIATTDILAAADGILVGAPTRYGNFPAQMRAFWDSTGQLWSKGALLHKFGGFFTSTATQHGGQESTILSFVSTFSHHGIIYVPLGYATPILFDLSEVNGGSPYGAGTIAGGDGSRQPSEKELQVGEAQGLHFANVVNKYNGH